MGSQTQTPFEVVRRFWAYNSDYSDWRKTDLIKVMHTDIRQQKSRKQDHIRNIKEK